MTNETKPEPTNSLMAHQLSVVLFQPEIPQNTGNIARTCVGTATKLCLIRPLGFRMDDHNTRRAGLDYWEHLDLEIEDSWQCFADKHLNDRQWFFSKSAQTDFTEANFSVGDYLVFGSETSGLPPSIMAENADRLVRIPTTKNIRSLNLSNAVAIAIYEAIRQISRI